MRGDVVAQPFSLGAEHERDGACGQGLADGRFRLAGEAEAPVAGLGHFLERASEIDHAHPRHDLECARGRFGDHPTFGRGVAVLRDQRGGIERRGRAQDRADVVRIGHLVENHQGPRRIAGEHLVEEQVRQGLAIEHEALVRRIARYHPGKVGHVGPFHRKIGRKFAIERGHALAGRPQLAVLAFGIHQRRFHGMASPQPHGPGRAPARAAPALHPPRPSAQRTAGPRLACIVVRVTLLSPLMLAAPALCHVSSNPSFARNLVALMADPPLTGKPRFAIGAASRPDGPLGGHTTAGNRHRHAGVDRWPSG